MSNVKVVKVDGRQEAFDKNKIVKSCVNAGASKDVAEKIAGEIEAKVKDGMRTTEIRRMVLRRLRDFNPEWADRWEFYDRLVKGRITFEDGKFIVVRNGNLYLGWQVRDVGSKGLSNAEEVEGILRELEEDLAHGIPPKKIHSRTYVLLMAVLRSKHMSSEEKKKSVELINEFRKKHGWKPFTLKKPIE